MTPGESVTLSVLRNGTRGDVTVQLAERPGTRPRSGGLSPVARPRLSRGALGPHGPRQDLRHHPSRGRRAGGHPRRVGDRLQLLARLQAPLRPGDRRRDRPRAAPQGRARRRVRQPHARRGRPARRGRRAHATSSCTATRGRRSARPSPQRTGARVIKGCGSDPAPTSATPSASTPTSTCSTQRPARPTAAPAARGTGRWRPSATRACR